MSPQTRFWIGFGYGNLLIAGIVAVVLAHHNGSLSQGEAAAIGWTLIGVALFLGTTLVMWGDDGEKSETEAGAPK